MKIIYGTLFFFSIISAAAQINIMPLAEAVKKGFTYRKLDSLYHGQRIFNEGTQAEYVKEENGWAIITSRRSTRGVLQKCVIYKTSIYTPVDLNIFPKEL